MVPFELHFDLGRRRRLVAHVAAWARYVPILGFTIGATVFAVVASPWVLVLLVAPHVLARGFYFGLLDILFVPVRTAVVRVTNDEIVFTLGVVRQTIALDGVMQVNRTDDTWTVLHADGASVQIPVTAITAEQVAFLKAAARRWVEQRVAAIHDRPLPASRSHEGES